MKADAAAGRLRRGIEEGLELVVDVLQGEIVREQGAVYLGELLENFCIGEQAVAHFDKGADDIDAHGDGLIRVQDAGGHEGSVLGENAREISPPSAACLWYRILRYQT